MTDAELLEGLADLGIPRDAWRVLVLIPLVQVAWADGRIQPPERELILRVAEEHRLLDGAPGEVLRRWLDDAPDAGQLATGRRLLVALAHRHRGLGAELDASALDEIQALAEQVARAAGGLFDAIFTVDDAERRALGEIRNSFGLGTASHLADLPEPEGGAWTDLDDDLG